MFYICVNKTNSATSTTINFIYSFLNAVKKEVSWKIFRANTHWLGATLKSTGSK